MVGGDGGGGVVRGPFGVVDRLARPPSDATTALVIGSPATAKVIPDLRRSAPVAAVGSGTRGCTDPRRGWAPRTSSPSDPERWTTTVDPTGTTEAATRPTWSSGVAMTSRSTPTAAASSGSSRPSAPLDSKSPAASSAATSDRPARPGPITRNVVTSPLSTFQPRRVPFASEKPCAAPQSVPTTATSPPASAMAASSDQVRGELPEGGEDEPAVTPAGMGHGQFGVVEHHAVDPHHVGIEGPRSPPGRPHPPGRRLQPAALLEQAVGIGARGQRPARPPR